MEKGKIRMSEEHIRQLHSLFSKIEVHLLNDDKPSEYLNAVYNDPMFRQFPFDMLYKLKKTEQSKVHHPEGNVWNHTMLVVDEAAQAKAKSRNPVVFMWAALLHDIGKPGTTRIRKGRITAYDHDKLGAELSVRFLECFTEDRGFIREVSELIRYHMHILYVLKSLPFADLQGLCKNTDIWEVALLGLCDRLGRTNPDRGKIEADIRFFIEKCNVSNKRMDL
jgi:putative nucleotidyltransferase with HDIG domain